MLQFTLATYDWALKHLTREGDTDLFPRPFEIQALKFLWRSLRSQFAAIDVTNYTWRGGRRFVVPKSTLAFRVATQLDPLDSLMIAAVIRKYGRLLERSRLPVSENRVFSYRFAPKPDGRLYADSPTWHDFWRASLDKSKRPGCGYVVVADIADFYNQVYHHVIERQIEDKAKLPAAAAKVIKKFIQTLTDKVSRGVPVGPHTSHILAECALDATDRSLVSHGYDFCRYVDDIHIFVQDEQAATVALYDLVQILDNQQRLILQNDKTRIMKAADFRSLAESMLIDRPANPREKEILDLIATKSHGDPYREVSLQSLTPTELRLLSQEVLEELLGHYLGAAKVDYPRLSWLLRRLTQVGAPGGVGYVLRKMGALSPILGPAARYLMSAVPHMTGDKHALGGEVLTALSHPVINKSPYLQVVLLDVLANLPELDHVDAVTARNSTSDPLVRREIVRVAGAGGRGDWLRDQKAGFRGADPWHRRALLHAATALPGDEAKFWLDSVKGNMSPLEKVVARHAFKDRDDKKLRLGAIEIGKG